MMTKPAAARTLPFDLADSPPEHLLPGGLTFQWIFNRDAVQFIAYNASREVTDAWFNKVREVSASWPPERPFFIINDFSAKDCVQTPYGRAKSKELVNSNTGLKVYSVTVVQNNLTMQLSRLFVRLIQRPNFRVHLTFSRADGQIWLKKHIDEYRAQRQNV